MVTKKRSYTYEYPHPAVTVDIVVFGVDERQENLDVLLVQRKEDPYKGSVALPGGFVGINESLEEAALRELREETNVVPAYVEQLYTFGEPRRDPRERVISVAYLVLVSQKHHVAKAGSDAVQVEWMPARKKHKLAFDHANILQIALSRLEAKIRYTPIGFDLLPEKFTLSELQQLYETVLGHQIDKRNFRRKVLALELLEELPGEDMNTIGRPATGYRFNKKKYDQLKLSGTNFEL
jgi:8-oxo-dGTP diphosphatase